MPAIPRRRHKLLYLIVVVFIAMGVNNLGSLDLWAANNASPFATVDHQASSPPTPTFGHSVTTASTPTPTATCWPTTFSGRAILQARSNHLGIQVGPVQTGFDGAYEFFLGAAGTYTIPADYPLYLPAEFVAVDACGPVALPTVMLLGGDTDDNGQINIADLVRIGAHYGTQPPTDPRADINADGQVNIFDLTMVGSNFGLSQSPWYTPTPGPTPTLPTRQNDKRPSSTHLFLEQPALVKAGEEFETRVRLRAADVVYGVDLRLAIDPTAIEVLDTDLDTEGLQARPGEWTPRSSQFIVKNEQEPEGALRYVVTRVGSAPLLSAEGVIVSLRARARIDGPPAVRLMETTLAGANGRRLMVDKDGAD